MSFALLLAAVVAASTSAAQMPMRPTALGHAAPAAAYTTRGTVRSFGKDRAYVNVEHEAIPGFMESMTMAFHPRRPEQLAGLAPGDAVRFAFTEDGNKRWLDWIEKAK